MEVELKLKRLHDIYLVTSINGKESERRYLLCNEGLRQIGLFEEPYETTLLLSNKFKDGYKKLDIETDYDGCHIFFNSFELIDTNILQDTWLFETFQFDSFSYYTLYYKFVSPE